MKTAIITGATSGLGFEAAKSLLRQKDWHVVVAARDPARNAEAVKKLARGRAKTRVEAMELDLGSLASVRRFADAVKARTDLPPIHALLNNAGLQFTSDTNRTGDGFESTFQINHLGHFLLTNLLLETLARPARIVFTSSGTHIPGEAPGIPDPVYPSAELVAFPDKDPGRKGMSPGAAGRLSYSTSKLCNMLCVYELDRRLEKAGMGAGAGEAGITVNGFDPGLMPGTGLVRDYPPLLKAVWYVVGPAIVLLPGNINTVRLSGKRLAALAWDPANKGVTAKYFTEGKTKPSSEDSYDRAKWTDLWEASTRWTGLAPDDSPVLKADLAA